MGDEPSSEKAGAVMAGFMAAHPGLVPLLSLTLTIGFYLLGLELQKLLRSPIVNPVLIAILLIVATLYLFHIPYATYFAGAQPLHFLLGPATVALAIPLVRSIEHMRARMLPMIVALFAGSMAGMVTGYGIVRAMGGAQSLALSMLPKSLTTPIAIGVAQKLGGIPSLTAVLAIAGGIVVAVCIDPVFRWIGIEEVGAVGLAAGTAGSGIGASKVIPVHPLAAAFAGIAIGANGFITAVLAPLVAGLLRHW